MSRKIVSLFLALLLAFSLFTPALSYQESDKLAAANTLHSLGLFNGVANTSNGEPVYALSSGMTREQGVVMLVRLLGKETEAKSGDFGSHPFSDVSAWADAYFDYAYAKGLVKGVGATYFNSGVSLGASEFITLVLRCLGYSDGVDFQWDSAWTLSDAIGLTAGEYCGNSSAFLRGDAALITCNALGVNLKSSTSTLLSQFVTSGLVTMSRVSELGLTNLLATSPMSARQIYEYSAPSVFLIETYASSWPDPYSIYTTGSGFFIHSSGVGVTNYHVVENSSCAAVVLADGTRHMIETVIYWDKDLDICVFTVSKSSLTGLSRSSFPYLPMAPHSSVYTGDEIYAVGCPLGLSATISDGIVGNRSRIASGLSGLFIQITAPISKGSSGGALLNVYGQVIGITTATYTDSQNMNLCIPMDRLISLNLSAGGVPYASAT